MGNTAIHPRLSFPQFLSELQRLGPGIDPHYDLQVRLLDLAHIRYDRLLDLKDMGQGLRPLLGDLGVPEAMLSRVPAVPQANQRKSGGAASWRTPENCRVIESLYAEDFDALGYARVADGTAPLS